MAKTKKIVENSETLPMMISTASTSSSGDTRRNVAGVIERTDRFKNIDDGLIPFKNSSLYGTNKSCIDIRDAVVLCQKCYYNFAIFRNIIDLMTEFSTSDLYFHGGSQKSRDFFQALFTKINLWDFQDQFFREYYRSGNVFTYRFDVSITPEDIAKITQVFGEKGFGQMPVDELKIPSRYVILNPADIRMMGSANFTVGTYYKALTPYEIQRLKVPQTEEDAEVFSVLPDNIKEQINKGNQSVLLPLLPEKISMVFYKKQDYEPFSVPMGYPVLEDINAKAEMKKIDMAIARTMQQIILLVTNGDEPEKGGINPKHLEALKVLFKNQSVGRVLVADYTTKAEFVVPDIGELLNPQKYEIIDRDINIGLNNVFVADEKFANQQQKVELFVARLAQGRKAFLNNFLMPEIKRIAQAVGLKNFPTPYFEDFELKDNSNLAKLYARLIEVGAITPQEGLQAIDSNTLPDPEVMLENQKEYKKQRDSGLYTPLIGGPKEGDGAGRPQGTMAPKKVTPIGGSEQKFSLTKVKDNLILAGEVEKKIAQKLKEKFGIKKLKKAQQTVAEEIAITIFSNEEPSNWTDQVIDSYLENPEDKNPKRVGEVISVGAEHQLTPYLSSILLASKIED